ncbi:MAG: glycosyltransferase family 4 protein [Bacteroidia bacterium]
MKILIVTYSFPPEWAGPSERFLRYSPKFQERGLELTFLTRSLRKGDIKENVHRGARVHRIAVKEDKFQFERFLRESSRFILKHRDEYQLVVSLSYSYVQYFLNKRILKHGIPIVGLHTMAIEHMVNKSLKSWIIHTLQKISLRANSHMVASTSYLKENLITNKYKGSNITVIPNGVDMTRFKPVDFEQRDNLRDRLSLPQKEKLVLFVGLRTPRKGVLNLVRGWKIYKDKYEGTGSLVLVGPERRENDNLKGFYQKWDEEVSKSEISKYRIELRAPSPDIQHYFQCCDLFTFMSVKEGLPNVIPEAMASGIPILMNQYEGYSEEVARDRKHVFITNDNPNVIAKNLYTMLNGSDSREILSYLSDNAFEWINETQPIDLSVGKFIVLFETLKLQSLKG